MAKVLSKIFSMPLMVLALAGFLFSIGRATFIEEWYNTAVAQKLVYQAKWFELILVYLALSLMFNMYRYKLFQWKKISSLVFHLAFLVILLGAALTRYAGFEGVMTIREGSSSNEIITSETYMQIKVHDNVQQYVVDLPVIMEKHTDNHFEHEFVFPGEEEEVKIEYVSLMENVKDTIIQVGKSQGSAYLEIVTVGRNGRFYNYLKSGDVLNDGAYKISFNNDEYVDAINIIETDSGLMVLSPFDLPYFQMADQTEGIIGKDSLQPFIKKRLYTVQQRQFAFNAFYPNAEVQVIESQEEIEGSKAVTVNVIQGDEQKEVILRGGKGLAPNKTRFKMGNLEYVLGFGSKIIELPFFIHLKDFQLERYPGTDKASSFASEVTLIDLENGVEKQHRIYMNNVLDYRGFRFFQSSYDPDEGGTILSVNQDRPGTYTSYLGYTLLGFGFLLNLFSRKSRFAMLLRKSKEVRQKRSNLTNILLVGLLGISLNNFSQTVGIQVIDYDHSEKYGRLIVQDEGGRFKPIHTMATDIMKKVHRGFTYNDQSAMQVFLGIHTDALNWQEEPIIYVSGQAIRNQLNLKGKYASLHEFFGIGFNEYALAEDAEKARRKKPASRTQYDKDVMKTDERVFILYGLFTGYYLRILPHRNDSNNKWYSPFDQQLPFVGEDKDFAETIIPYYNMSVSAGHKTGEWGTADKMIDLISGYQRAVGPEDLLPSKTEIEMEIAYNKMDIFKRLMGYYVILGLILLVFAFIQLFIPKYSFLKWPLKIGAWLFLLLFVFHGLGLGMRWYLSGHAPWSNGYEAVVFIAFITVMAGLIFSRKNKVVLGATGILASLMLFVAHMSAMDPEITNLVPVLKSFWLKIHVAIITGSYGFLGLGAILGLIILIMNLFLTSSNKKRMLMTTKELTYVSEMVIIIGLFMLTIGTFLGGVWASESWGRYWGWDAKETWALASVVTYAIILHLRFIPFLKSQYAFNVATLWGYASIVMTFFGVNFYLSGLHSYATGDPMPFPMWATVTIISLFVLSIASYFRLRAKAEPVDRSLETKEH
ncbi:cytochrome c biogenesis protein CcsA [Crocinitomix catalasitica]|nr:cytochrome c biogenesis protein CcsA [Crocinitomix catalasitica]